MPVDLCFILGGSKRREVAALKTCLKKFPGVPIWISGPELTEDCLQVCEEEGVNPELLRIDYRAVDTLSNFTTMAPEMYKGGFKKVAIITSRYHMKRARTIASIIMPEFKVRYVPIAIMYKADSEKENLVKVWRDQIRSYLWVYFRYDVTKSLLEWYHKDRVDMVTDKIERFSHYGNRAHVANADD
mmetsp:Transcript_2176/g.2500  ORF Transcript_2176/g.2500 Transcript_2176/m.2500 type:complete len:186 (-) Transcript_2176:770-1327(-)|eukprot:CAMPEP_0184018458 /NCGR_PEP_ID=MMETSP0954-20121128/8160_1 /TAXON_ID=627963 /ORGANISM="Aplanochytrium sp, Strain PBS07" /LENGTH=185 /DNA_ID=CAMNT_0026299921 /DNA_START=110 /DNA_END=667 /DNA_ORIENTATION=-